MPRSTASLASAQRVTRAPRQCAPQHDRALAAHSAALLDRMRAALSLSLCALILALTACGDASGDELSRPDERAGTSDVLARGEATAAEQTAAARAAVEAHPVATVVVLGDSISAGLHLDEDEAFPALVAARLAADGLPVRMINAGVSGDTSAGGLRRVDWLLKQRPHVLVVELGGNDGLRGQPVTEISANLSGIVERARAAGATPLLLGMALPASMGPDYVAEFRDAYASLAERFELAFVPGFMDDVGGRPALNLADGLHPNAAGHALLADKLYPELRRVVAEVSGLD